MSKPIGSTPPSLRRLNASALLRHALGSDVFTASDAMASTGLSRATVIGLCDELVERGWLEELADTRGDDYRLGRPARRYTLRDRAGLLVGVDAAPHHVTTIVADLRGAVVERVTRRLDPDAVTPDERRAFVASVVDDALDAAGAVDADVLSCVVAVPAPTDAEGASPYGRGGWWASMNPGYAQEFAARGWQVVVENDANLAALAERALGEGRNVPSFATLLSGERFGAGFVVNDRLVRGSRGATGEMHVLELVSDVGSADGLGLLARKWVREAREAGELPAGSVLARLPLDELQAPAVFAAADAGDAAALAIVERLAERLARIAAILAGILDVDRMIVAGAVAPSVGLLLERARPYLERFSRPSAPDLVASTLGDSVVGLGAVTRALDLVREDPLSFSPAEPVQAGAEAP
ncbi:ROK family protein [Herbiconiux sp. SYSU D00978]|uniref:ROK family protein n=1 Tax=Herbiconiux sp. SYSU D00978 TaxID=2812562 RepID=UPI001A977FC8|nr:ROK family protein [Herbiconiux sp. SYSU D00978]